VLGATHPNELRRYGQAYRLSLEILATKNKLEKHVIFCNQFVNPENLTEFMGAADLYITPYLNAAQITSGTLSFAFGSGKAVVPHLTGTRQTCWLTAGAPWSRLPIRRPWQSRFLASCVTKHDVTPCARMPTG
jgi:hypothetical protein